MRAGEEDRKHLDDLIYMTKRLEVAQWWVEDAVLSVGNVPAHWTLMDEIQPMHNSIVSVIDSVLMEIGSRNGSAGALAISLVSLKREIQVTFLGMHDFVDSAEDWTLHEINNGLSSARTIIESLPGDSVSGSDEMSETVNWLKTEFNAYDNLLTEAITQRNADNWNTARWTMETEVIPLTNRLTQGLNLLSLKYSRIMKEQAESAAFMSWFVTILIVTLTLTMIVAAVAMSRRNAVRITTPLAALSQAADAMAEGKHVGDIPVDSDDEVGRLTGVFNRMRSALGEKEASLKQRADELEKANKEMESFIYSVSHDLKVPMITIQGMAKLLEREIGPGMTKDSQTYFNYIFGASATMSDLLDDLLEMSRVGRMDINPAVVDMNALAQKVFAEALAYSKGREFALVAHPGLPPIYANSKRVYQLLSNLVSNAIKFMPSNIAKPVVEIGWLPGAPEGFAEFFVRDNGAGIDPKYHEKIFTLFNRLHGKEIEGTGMGLAFVKKILDNMGCVINLESEQGKGATFYFTLPKIPEDL
jgi:two-component system sensor kinase